MSRSTCTRMGAGYVAGSVISVIPTYLLGVHSYYGSVGMGCLGLGMLLAAWRMRGAR